MDSIRYPVGVQWNSNLEVGLRLLAWVRCHILCANSAAWDDEFVTRFITCVYIHTRHLARELTVHHAPGNHLLGEAAALFYISVLYPFFTDSAKWRNDRCKNIGSARADHNSAGWRVRRAVYGVFPVRCGVPAASNPFGQISRHRLFPRRFFSVLRRVWTLFKQFPKIPAKSP